MAKYQTGNDLGGTQQVMTTTYKTLVTTIGAASAPRRLKIYDFLIGTTGTPADNYLEWDISRMTADDGTKTNVTPTALDPADPAAATLSRANFTAEGTITATSSVFYLGLNQRASYRWVASPGGELVGPATAAAGFAVRAKSAVYVLTCGAKVYFEEQ